MASGVTGYFDLAGGAGITLRIHYSQSYTVETNKSTVSITQIEVASTDYYGVTYYLDGSITIAGTTAISMSSSGGTHRVNLQTMGESAFYPLTGTLGAVEIAHEADGSKSVAIAVSVRGYTTSGGAGSGWSVSGSQTVTLTTIPRASTIGATDANIGAVSMIAIGRKSSAYTHSIQYQFAALSGWITASGGVSPSEVRLTAVSIPWVIPAAFYAQIPDAKSGTVTLTCRTYSGSTQIGDDQAATIAATASADKCAPVVSGTVVDSNDETIALTGDANVLVRYCSTALCTISAEARNSASVASKTIAGKVVTGDTRSIANVEVGTFAFGATDSRGYTTVSESVVKAMIDYVQLTNNPVAVRPAPTTGEAVLTVKGDYFNGSFGAVDNALEIYYRIGSGSYVPVTPEISGNSYSAEVALSGMIYTQSYQIEVVVTDKLSRVPKKATLMRGLPVFDWGEDDFVFHVPATVPDPTEDGHAVPKSYADAIAAGAAPALASADHPGCYYRIVDDAIEWLNPPMEIGVEYRTTERYNGKAVYAMLVDCGSFSNDKKVSVTVAGITSIIRTSVVAGPYALPAINNNDLSNTNSAHFWFARTSTGFYIWLYGGNTFANATGQTYAEAYYTK